ncbi:hypothetical protein N0V90_005437 [Kalmusia sp. IMI 367209]|nr:hypothetical protein N0V90_005437 [Kalmusia sp. IMI 367209]
MELPSSQQQQQQPRGRYYAHALTGEDKVALAIGEKNHNLREWTADDLVQYQVSRIELVPYNDNRQEVIEVLMDEKHGSERFLLKSEQHVRHLTGFPLTKLDLVSESKQKETCTQQTRHVVSHDMVDLRTVSMPNPNPSPTTPSLPKPPAVSGTQQQRHSAYGGLGSSAEYFSKKPGRKSMTPSPRSSDSSHNSGHIRSPLAPDGRPYIRRADVTFDTFLEPHASGKGETYRDSEHSKKKEPQGLRRLSKMTSMPKLRKRFSQLSLSGHKD